MKFTHTCSNLIIFDQISSNLTKLDQIEIQGCRRSIGPFAHLFKMCQKTVSLSFRKFWDKM